MEGIVDQNALSQLVELGVSQTVAREALLKYNNDVARAADDILSNSCAIPKDINQTMEIGDDEDMNAALNVALKASMEETFEEDFKRALSESMASSGQDNDLKKALSESTEQEDEDLKKALSESVEEYELDSDLVKALSESMETSHYGDNDSASK